MHDIHYTGEEHQNSKLILCAVFSLLAFVKEVIGNIPGAANGLALKPTH